MVDGAILSQPVSLCHFSRAWVSSSACCSALRGASAWRLALSCCNFGSSSAESGAAFLLRLRFEQWQTGWQWSCHSRAVFRCHVVTADSRSLAATGLNHGTRVSPGFDKSINTVAEHSALSGPTSSPMGLKIGGVVFVGDLLAPCVKVFFSSEQNSR